MTSCTQYCILDIILKGYFQERRWIFESGCGFFESVCGILRESWKLGRHLHLQLSVCGQWERLWNV